MGSFRPLVNSRPIVLVCDDDPLIVELMQIRLAAKGYSVETASDGVEAMEKAAEIHPQAIVLDAMMPRADGMEVLSRLKADPLLSDIPVIMLTARKREKDILDGLERGADDYLVKPFIPEELFARLSRLIKQRDRPAR